MVYIKDLIKKRKFYKNKINNISNKKVKLHHISSIPTNDNFKWNILSNEDKVDVINRLKNELQNDPGFVLKKGLGLHYLYKKGTRGEYVQSYHYVQRE